MQINNLKIKYSKLYNKYQVITLDNKTVLEEFKTEEQAIKCAKNIEETVLEERTYKRIV